MAALILIAWTGSLLVAPGSAQAQTALHEIKWAHDAPDYVARFVVFVSPTEGDADAAQFINVGKPANPFASGSTFIYSAIISADPTQFVAIAAVGLDGTVSPLSTWSGLPPTPPGQPFLIP